MMFRFVVKSTQVTQTAKNGGFWKISSKCFRRRVANTGVCTLPVVEKTNSKIRPRVLHCTVVFTSSV